MTRSYWLPSSARAFLRSRLKCPPGGILEGRDDIHHFGRILLDLGLHILQHQPVVIRLAGDAPGLEHFEDLDGMHKGGRLDQDHIPRLKI